MTYWDAIGVEAETEGNWKLDRELKVLRLGLSGCIQEKKAGAHY